MNIIPISRDISSATIEARGGYIVSVFHHPTNRSIYGFEIASVDALGWLYASRLIFDKAEGKA